MENIDNHTYICHIFIGHVKKVINIVWKVFLCMMNKNVYVTCLKLFILIV